MADQILEDVVLGQDCIFSLATATYSGVLVNLETMGADFSYRVESFEPAMSQIAGKVLTKEETPVVTINVFSGKNTTFDGFYRNVYGKKVTNFVCTDFPTWSEMETRYGTAHVTAISKSQSGGPGTFTVTISWATLTHGYTPA